MARRIVRGFTLIELLVVVGIIGLLMAILLPALSRARQQAIRVTCASQQRQWGQAGATFAGDHNNSFPDNMAGADMAWNSPIIRDQFIANYLVPMTMDVTNPDFNVLYCPTDAWHRHQDPTTVYNGALVGYQWLPYRNTQLYQYQNIEGWVGKTRYDGAHARSPIMMNIMQSWGGSEERQQAITDSAWLYDGSNAYSSHAGHNGVPQGANFLFEDGSVQWRNFDEIELGTTLGHPWRIWGYVDIAGRTTY